MLAPLGALIFKMLTFILSRDIKVGIQRVSHENKLKYPTQKRQALKFLV
jgi:hypothetical protein